MASNTCSESHLFRLANPIMQTFRIDSEMASELSIKLEGFPEKLQRIADAIDEAFPGMVAWVQSQDLTDGVTIKIEGYEIPLLPMREARTQAA